MNLPTPFSILGVLCVSLAPCFGEPEPARVHEVTVYERMLGPLLNLLAAEYVKAGEPRKREIEYSAYLANRTYWVHTQKFHHERSPGVEKILGLLNLELIPSKEFVQLFRDWRTHHPEGFPSATRYFTKFKDGTELDFQVATIENWIQLHGELFEFVERTAMDCRTKIDTMQQKRDSKKKSEQAGTEQPATRSELKSEGGDELQPESEKGSR